MLELFEGAFINVVEEIFFVYEVHDHVNQMNVVMLLNFLLNFIKIVEGDDRTLFKVSAVEFYCSLVFDGTHEIEVF